MNSHIALWEPTDAPQQTSNAKSCERASDDVQVIAL
jgi:hypothetical protein